MAEVAPKCKVAEKEQGKKFDSHFVQYSSPIPLTFSFDPEPLFLKKTPIFLCASC